MLLDRVGRPITYLRISVTDRCNFRCVYCMPAEGIPRRTHESIITYEEIVEVARVAAEQGVRKVRLTGGEPLVRLDLPDLVRMIAQIPQIEDISLTTNGFLLERMAAELVDAGLTRINVSLDTLNPQKFSRITRGGSIETVWRGLELSEKLGLAPIKINTVAMRGVNDDELIDLAMLSVERGWNVRFIELMPVKNQETWGPDFPDPADAFISIAEIKQRLEPLHLTPVNEEAHFGPARDYTIEGARGLVGFISPLSDHFCETCNRMRMTADGSFRPCLLHDLEVPFLAQMRTGSPVLPFLKTAVDIKPEGHELGEKPAPDDRSMMQIGG